MQNKKLKNRDLYLNKLKMFKEIDSIKIITGIRRCGKSSLMKLMIEDLLNDGINQEQIIHMNFESYEYRQMDEKMFYTYVKNKIIQNKKMYLFFDEVHKILNWEIVINAFRVDFNCDIYLTGSNSHLLSSEYSTYLSGRYFEIKMLPLNFKEFLDFYDYKIENINSPLGIKKIISDLNDYQYSLEEVFNIYLRYGGMPGIIDFGLEQEKTSIFHDSIYSTVVLKDILEREERKNNKKITNPSLLKKIILFLADNIGNNASLRSISNKLTSEKIIVDYDKNKVTSLNTIQLYVQALLESYLFYEVKRFDIKGKEYLATLGKYYIVDLGLKNFLLGYQNRDIGHNIENIVYFELLARGYEVAVGKVNNLEIDFIATKNQEKIYIQVSQTLLDPDTKNKELKPLLQIKDNYEKIILSLDNFEDSYEGIKIINLVNWLLK